jgi:hypothetical protein
MLHSGSRDRALDPSWEGLMIRGLRLDRNRAGFLTALAVVIAAALAAPAAAGPTPGFVETWADSGDTRGWGGGSIYENPGHGGTGGATEGFLLVSTSFSSRLGSVSFGAEYTGDWQAAGIKGIRVSLNDVNGHDALEIHFGIGTRENYWQYDESFRPPDHAWGEFAVDLTSAAGFTQIRGPGSFEAALQNADRMHFRHDLAPFTGEPDLIQGDFGVDNLRLTDQSVPVLPTTWGRIKRLYR